MPLAYRILAAYGAAALITFCLFFARTSRADREWFLNALFWSAFWPLTVFLGIRCRTKRRSYRFLKRE